MFPDRGPADGDLQFLAWMHEVNKVLDTSKVFWIVNMIDKCIDEDTREDPAPAGVERCIRTHQAQIASDLQARGFASARVFPVSAECARRASAALAEPGSGKASLRLSRLALWFGDESEPDPQANLRLSGIPALASELRRYLADHGLRLRRDAARRRCMAWSQAVAQDGEQRSALAKLNLDQLVQLKDIENLEVRDKEGRSFFVFLTASAETLDQHLVDATLNDVVERLTTALGLGGMAAVGVLVDVLLFGGIITTMTTISVVSVSGPAGVRTRGVGTGVGRIAERLMLRAASSAPAAGQRALLDAYLAFCLRHNQPLAAFDYLAGDEVLRGDDPRLVRRYMDLAEQLGRDAELSAGLDWLRAHGDWGEQETRHERALIRRHSRELLTADAPETQSALGALRRFGQRVGLALNGRRPSVLELVPADLPLQVGEADVRRMAGPARLDMGRLLAGALDPMSTKVALVGLAGTAQQLLWLGQIDPSVVEAIRFAGTGDPHALQQLTASTRWFADGDLEGNLPRLAGYVAEQQTRLHLLQQGHQVEMPTSPTQVGYDMLVDGVPTQVKHCDGASLIEAHRAAHPDIPVIANAEHAGHYQDDPMVWIDPERFYADPYDSIDATLEALHDVPLVTLAPLHLILAGVRHLGRTRDWRQYAEHVAKDAGAGIVCTAGGAWLFSGVAGIALGPVGVAIAGTLGAMIGSGVGDSLGKGWIGDDIGARNDAAAEGLVDLARWTREEAILDKLDAATREWNRLRRWLTEPVRVPLPLSITAFWRALAQARVDQLTLFTERLDRRLAGCESDQIRAGWQVLQAAGQIAHPGMRPRVITVRDRLAALRA